MNSGRIDDRIAQINGQSEAMFGEPREVEAAEAEALLRAAGIDPSQLKESLYVKFQERGAKYTSDGKLLPPLLRQALEDLQPNVDAIGEGSPSMPVARLHVKRLLTAIKSLPRLLEINTAPVFTAAYRKRTELSASDRMVLDKISEGLRKNRRNKDDRKRNRGHAGRERRGPAYAKALLAELSKTRIDVREIAASLELEVLEVAADGFEGALIRARDLPFGAIAVRNSIREAGRKNFTIAHEIGHFVLPGHEHASVACTVSDVGNWPGASTQREFEREANEFAAELLMPAKLVAGFVRRAAPSLAMIEKIARQFDVSLSAAAWRYCDITVEKCAVVWSTDGVVQWVKRASGFPFVLAKGKPVEYGTFAAACFAGERVPGQPQAVPSQLWIDSNTAESPASMLEQSKALASYRSVISLLWIDESTA